MRRLITLLFLLLTACQINTNAITANLVAEVQIDESPTATCTDSDGGIEPGIPGDVRGVTERNEEYLFEDDCGGSVLVEFYCDGNEPKSKNTNCESGCRSGACK